MSAPHITSESERRTYGMWTRPRSEGLFGLSWITTLALFAAIVTAMLTFAFIGFIPGLVVVGIEGIVLAPMALTIDGRTGYERGILMVQWYRMWRRRENVYRSGAFSRLGTCKLPGLMAASRLYDALATDGHRFGMVHYPDHGLYTVLVKTWPQGARADQDRIDDWVAAWGQLLADIGGHPDVEAITVVNDSLPETGNRLGAEVDTLTRTDAPEMAQQVMYELADMLPRDTVRTETWCSITFRATTPARRNDPEEQAVEIGRRLPGILAALLDAGVRGVPMNGSEVIAVVRRAWDPASEVDLEFAAEHGQPHGISWDDVGPIAYEETRQALWHDGVTSITWEMAAAPEGNVDEKVLIRLLAPREDIPRKRVTLICRPHSAADATEIVDRDYKDALTAENTARGVGSAHTRIRVEATEQAREEQARGHGVVRFGVLITITEPDGADLPAVDALTRDLATQARLKIRRCYRFQSAAFAAALGAGVLLPEMATMPRAVAG